MRCDVGGKYDLAVGLDAFELASAFAFSANLKSDILALVVDEKIRGFLSPRAFEIM